MTRRTTGRVIALIALVSFGALGHARSDWRDRPFVPFVPPSPLQHPLPRPGSTERLLLQVARQAGIPFGFEWSRDPLPDSVVEPTTNELAQMTVGQALDAIEHADARYASLELDGVLVIRPVTAWNDPHHFLNRPVGSLNLVGTNSEIVLNQVMTWLYPDQPGRPAWELPPSSEKFDLRVIDGTVLKVLDATVIAGGNLCWILHYGQPTMGAPRYPTAAWMNLSIRAAGMPPRSGPGWGWGRRGIPPAWTEPRP